MSCLRLRTPTLFHFRWSLQETARRRRDSDEARLSRHPRGMSFPRADACSRFPAASCAGARGNTQAYQSNAPSANLAAVIDRLVTLDWGVAVKSNPPPESCVRRIDGGLHAGRPDSNRSNEQPRWSGKHRDNALITVSRVGGAEDGVEGVQCRSDPMRGQVACRASTDHERLSAGGSFRNSPGFARDASG